MLYIRDDDKCKSISLQFVLKYDVLYHFHGQMLRNSTERISRGPFDSKNFQKNTVIPTVPVFCSKQTGV